LLEGVFPDYKQVIPNSYNIEITLPKEELVGAIKRTTIAEEDENKPIKMTLTKNKLTISTASRLSTDAYAEDEIDINYDGQDFEIGFNGKYVLEAVDKIDSNNVIIKFINKDSQSTFIPENTEEKYLALVMPMTLRET
jgi:DNA polymerase sliding clamp subunit (PCNA homolog)